MNKNYYNSYFVLLIERKKANKAPKYEIKFIIYNIESYFE